MSDSFKIKTGVCKETEYHRSSSTLLWKHHNNLGKSLQVEGINEIHLEGKGQNVEIKCLVFAIDLTLLAQSLDAQIMSENWTKSLKKPGLKMHKNTGTREKDTWRKIQIIENLYTSENVYNPTDCINANKERKVQPEN